MFRYLALFLCVAGLVAGDVLPSLPRRWMNAHSESRVVGGQTASTGDFPYQVSVRTTANFHFCGGTLINTRWVLTACHCVVGRQPSSVRVVVGSAQLSGGTAYNIQTIRTNSAYNSNNLANDVAVMQTSTTVTTSNNVSPIPLATQNYQSGSAILSGWGATQQGGSAPSTLQWSTRTLISLSSCQSYVTANADSVCTSGQSGQGFCNGDSGGPLSINKNEVAGIVSGYFGSCGGGWPDMYCSVYYHRNWINTNIN